MTRFKAIIEKWKQPFIIICILLGCLFAGYGLGHRHGYSKAFSNSENIAQNIIENESATKNENVSNSNQSSTSSNTTENNQLNSIIFLKPNTQPRECPNTHTIKGVYSNDLGYFYMKSNRFYERVKPDICFTSRDVAIEVAGFIQKF